MRSTAEKWWCGPLVIENQTGESYYLSTETEINREKKTAGKTEARKGFRKVIKSRGNALQTVEGTNKRFKIGVTGQREKGT